MAALVYILAELLPHLTWEFVSLKGGLRARGFGVCAFAPLPEGVTLAVEHLVTRGLYFAAAWACFTSAEPPGVQWPVQHTVLCTSLSDHASRLPCLASIPLCS